MPIEATASESLVVPAEVKPAIEAKQLWIKTIVIQAPIEGMDGSVPWSAIIESNPSDGTKAYYRDSNGNDTTVRVESQSLFADAAKDPTLMKDINDVMKAIIVVAEKVKALRDAEKEAARLAAA